MSEVEKQESQKTVVAFITGLLIGGLLVWVFSSTPTENKEVSVEETTNTEEVAKVEVTSEKIEGEADVIGTGSLTVLDQKAGTVVTLDAVQAPTKNGWVVVREYMDGVPGNILGAARYSADEGLMPKTVELVRGTQVGSSYQVVFFTQGGDISFSLTDDTVVSGIATTFKAK